MRLFLQITSYIMQGVVVQELRSKPEPSADPPTSPANFGRRSAPFPPAGVDGALTWMIRKMTAAERKRYPPRPAKARKSSRR